MADLTANDVTVSVQKTEIVESQRRTRVKLTFGDGVLTYPAGGVPLPVIGKLGMVRNLDALILYDASDASGFVWKYDSENRKLRAYEGDYAQVADAPLAELDGGTDTVPAQTLFAEAVGW